MPCKKNCRCKSCFLLLRALPPFPVAGSSGVLANRQLQVATGFSPGTPLTNYQFTDLQTAINYANSLGPTVNNPIAIQLYPGLYSGDITLYDNVHISGFGDIAQTFINGNVTYNSTGTSYNGISNLSIIGDVSFTLNSTGSKLSNFNVYFGGSVTYSTTTATNIEILLNSCVYDDVTFGPMVGRTNATERTVEVKNSIFRANVLIGTTAGAGNVSVVNMTGSTFEEGSAVTVGNGTSASILRANSCEFLVGGTLASPTGASVFVNTGAFANLMGSPIPQTAVTGAGTADMDLMINTAMSSSVSPGTGVLFGTAYGSLGFGTVTNTSNTGYYVSVVPATATPVAVGALTLSGTGFVLASASGTVTNMVGVHRVMSPI